MNIVNSIMQLETRRVSGSSLGKLKHSSIQSGAKTVSNNDKNA